MKGSLFLAIFTGLYFWFFAGAPGYTLHYVFKQPIVVALPIGLILGDVKTAMMVGAAIEMVYVGIVAAGANLPADECLAGVIAIPIALQIGVDPSTAVVLAVPFGVLGVFLDQLRRTINASFIHKADKLALEGDIKGITKCALIYPMAIGFIMRFPPVFVANLFGAKVVENFLNVMPEWIIHGLNVTGGVLPALGFAITVFVIGEKTLMPFFFLGFFAVKYLEINTMASAIFGICIALLITLMRREERQEISTDIKPDEKNNMIDKENLLTKKDVVRSYNRWYLSCEISNSYERMQALAFCYSILPILKKLYKKKEDLSAALVRHLNFFNTQGIWGTPVHGVTIAMEEAKAKGEDIPESAITGIKTGLMGPLAGIGDTVDWGTWKPLIFSLAASFSAGGSIAGFFICFLFAIITYFEGYYLWNKGYSLGTNAVTTLLQSGFVKELITGSSILGLFMMGSLSANIVKLDIPIEFMMAGKMTTIQSILDSILPGMLPLLAVLSIYWYLKNKGQNFGKIVFIILAACMLGSLVGIF